MSQNASHETNLSKIVALMDELLKAERYGSFAASATGSFAFSMASNIVSIQERTEQLHEMDERDIPKYDRRRERIGNWLKDEENRLDRNQEFYNWFLTIARNEGMNDFVTSKASEVMTLLKNPQNPEIEELEHHAKMIGCTLAEAKEDFIRHAKADAESISKREDTITPLLQHRLDGLKNEKAMAKLAKKFGAKAEKFVNDVVELDNFEARRLAEMIERKADQYAENAYDQILRIRGRTSRQRRRKEQVAGTMRLLREIVKDAGKFADELTTRIDAGDKREGEEHYDSEHGTTTVVA